MRTRTVNWLCPALVAFSFVRPVSGQLIISAFMAAHGSGRRDEDHAFSDWFEIYNRAGTNVNAGGPGHPAIQTASGFRTELLEPRA